MVIILYIIYVYYGVYLYSVFEIIVIIITLFSFVRCTTHARWIQTNRTGRRLLGVNRARRGRSYSYFYGLVRFTTWTKKKKNQRHARCCNLSTSNVKNLLSKVTHYNEDAAIFSRTKLYPRLSNTNLILFFAVIILKCPCNFVIKKKILFPRYMPF